MYTLLTSQFSLPPRLSLSTNRQFTQLHLHGLHLHPRGWSFHQLPRAVCNPGQQLCQGVMELAQLQESIFQLVFPAETVRVELGPGGSQLLQLLGDLRTIL